MNAGLDLAYSIADQHFQRTKSVGILNFSVQFLAQLAGDGGVRRLTVLDNSTLAPSLQLPAGAQRQIHDRAVSGRLGRLWWDQYGVYRAAQQSGADWLFLPKGFASFMRRSPVRLSAYLADVMPDYYQRKYPGGFPRFETWYFLSCMRATLGQARVVFTNSDFSREEIARVARERGWPIPRLRTLGIGFIQPSVSATKEDRILLLASPLPHKRTAMAVEFLAQWQKTTDYPGVIHWVGRLPQGTALPAFPRWQLDARLDEAAYRNAVAKSRVLIFTSEYEGFGMPPVEAVLAGAAPVYSSIPATIEVMGGAGFPFANDSYASFAEALNQALQAPAGRLDMWRAQVLARHNWDKVVNTFLSELQNAS